MAATTSQGKTFTLFMVGATTAAAGLAYVSSGAGMAALVLGLILVVASFIGFIRIKPTEGRTGSTEQPLALKLAGIISILLGWCIVLGGIHLTASVSGRMVTSLVGLAISLVGVCYFLPVASSKNAIWKA
ncbi:MAG TPA: hypothetical protein VGS10_22625 [Terracidiphilus sp.]|nr:hypothetical protein [Terracidiphilus sp.]